MASFKLAALLRNPQAWICGIGLFALLGLATGALAQSGNVYGDRSAQAASPVLRAVVLQVRDVAVQTDNTTRYAGTAAGAALGGGIGAAIGRKSSTAQAVFALVGSTLGGLAGNRVTESLAAVQAVEYIVSVASPGHAPAEMAITQPSPSERLNAGEQALLINTQGTWRVVRAFAMPVASTGLLAPSQQLRQPAAAGVRSPGSTWDERL